MERERITISIKKKVLDSIDNTIDGVTVRNRSHAIETLVSKALDLSDTKNAVVLLGGDDALKLIPSVKQNLEILKKAGFEKVYIAVGYLADKIKDKLGDGKEFEMKLEYLTGGEGSGGAILTLKKKFKRTFIVINSQEKLNLDLIKLMEFHRKHGNTATVTTADLEDLLGLYLFEPEIFKYIPNGFSMLETDVLPKLAQENKLIVCPVI